MLLTGFDAAVEQVMFLDKPLKGAKLLQAIMRTNRPYAEKNKDRGIIVDYWGVFDRLEAAFAEFSPEDVDMAVLDLSELKQQFPVRIAEALALVAGMPDANEYVKRLDDAPGSPEEKAAEIEAALEYEIKVGGGEKNPVTRSLAERLERIRQKKAEADADMLSLLEELVNDLVSEQQAREALGL